MRACWEDAAGKKYQGTEVAIYLPFSHASCGISEWIRYVLGISFLRMCATAGADGALFLLRDQSLMCKIATGSLLGPKICRWEYVTQPGKEVRRGFTNVYFYFPSGFCQAHRRWKGTIVASKKARIPQVSSYAPQHPTLDPPCNVVRQVQASWRSETPGNPKCIPSIVHLTKLSIYVHFTTVGTLKSEL